MNVLGKPQPGEILTIRLKDQMPEEEVAKLAGKQLTAGAVKILVTGDTDVYKPNGDLLLKFRKGAISPELCASILPIMRTAATETDNRGMAAGAPELKDRPPNMIGQEGNRMVVVKKDGTVKKWRSSKPVKSGVIGFFDRSGQFPYCRLTAFNLNHPNRFNAALPFIKRVNALFAELVPERYEAQMAVVRRTASDFYISGTAFTTLTVNKNFTTAVHKDAGDLKEGCGIMACLRLGSYSGCLTCWPAFGVAVDMEMGDLVAADVHEWHGNTPLVGKPGRFERISLIFYYRELMAECGTAEEELERVKKKRDEFHYRDKAGTR